MCKLLVLQRLGIRIVNINLMMMLVCLIANFEGKMI